MVVKRYPDSLNEEKPTEQKKKKAKAKISALVSKCNITVLRNLSVQQENVQTFRLE